MHISQNEPHLPKVTNMLAAIMKELGTGDGASTATRCRMALIEAIKTGVLPSGARLIEADLCAAFSVSRTPLREALAALRADGILDADSQTLRVRKLAWRDIHDLYDMRVLLEGAAAYYAAHHAGSAEKQVLASLVSTEENLIAQQAPPDVMARHNVQFHQAIIEASRNPFLKEALARLSHLFILIGDTAYRLKDRVLVIQTQHAAICEAIENSDANAARQAMETHLKDALAARLRLLSCDSPDGQK